MIEDVTEAVKGVMIPARPHMNGMTVTLRLLNAQKEREKEKRKKGKKERRD